MHQPLRNKDMEMTIVTTNPARQGPTRKGVRYVLTFGLLGLIFAFSMMLVIVGSRLPILEGTSRQLSRFMGTPTVKGD